MLATFLAAAALVAAPASAQQAQVSLQPYASGLSALTTVTSTRAEPRRLYAVEQLGRIRYVVNGRVAGTFIDLRDRITSGGEQGLLGLAFHPNYARNHRFYVDYTDRNGNTNVVEFRSRSGRGVKSTARRLLFVRQPYANHNGGDLQFDRSGLLYVGMGDGGSAGDPGNRAQNPRERLGKLLRINPLRRGAKWQLVGLGVRNPWRFSFDRATGDLYVGDVGQGNWEEIDFRPRSALGRLANYGWRAFEGRTRYTNTTLGPGQLVDPVYVFSHADNNCSVTGGFVYRGRSVAAAAGRYFFGDYCSGIVWSFRIAGGQATEVRREPFRVGSLTSFGEDAGGELYFATGDGRIYRLGA
ncbi:MAG: PQQ-dependent sugar dehydrogenase [Gaiellaceae bacterium]|jgi:glucose/arabinose dehydrogenase